jgi:very-short-patch-repair endonuclease
MNNVEHLKNLAKYYRDLLFSLSSQVGKHFVDIKAVLRYGLTADLSLFVPEIEELITSGTISFTIDKASSSVVNKIIEKANEIEDKEEQGEISEDIEVSLEGQERKKASAILVAIYRKQEFDPYNREVIIGFPLVSGKVEKKKFCAPLFYYKVRIDFDPLKGLITLTKDFEIPALNFQLIKHLVESDEDIEMIRQQILPHLYREDFGLSTIQEIIQRLSELVEGFRGLSYSLKPSFLREALELRETAGANILNTSIIVNARRTNAYLLDDLAQLAQIEEIDDETIINTILSEPVEIENEDIKNDKNISENQSLLLFPLLNNKAQRLAAIKAEKGRLLVIQGPPGTGKSQTIVNLICHLVAQGKTVLATSHQNKALEVITKIMPNINYLAMSLLKGEIESINELRNKIEGFHSYVSNVDIGDYKKSLEERWADLSENNYDINRLQVRFSELKTLERDQYSIYHKYHKIRDYDVIDASDSVPEGTDSAISSALSEYSKLLKNLRKDYLRIENLLPDDDPEKLKARSNYLLSFINYCEICNYDLIDPADSIPDGMDSLVGEALSEYLSLLRGLRDNYSDIEKILSYSDPKETEGDYILVRCRYCGVKSRLTEGKVDLDLICWHCGQTIGIQDNNIDASIENIGKLIDSYDLVKKNLFSYAETINFCQQLSKSSLKNDEIIDYLDNLINWTSQHFNKLVGSLKLLTEAYNLKIDFQTSKNQCARYGAEIENIIKCIENLSSKLQSLKEYKINDEYPEHPDNPLLEEVTLHIEVLGDASGSWWKWYLLSKAQKARKFFGAHQFPRVTYKNRFGFLRNIKAWHSYWKLRNHIARDLKYLAEMDIPIKNLSLKPSLGELHQNANLALQYSHLIGAINSFPVTSIDTIKDFMEQQIASVSSSEDIFKFKESLEKSRIYLETCTTLNKLKSNSHFAYLCDTLFSPVEESIYELVPNEKADKIVKRLKDLYPYFQDYKRIKILKETTLKTLPRTCLRLKNEIIKENNISLFHPELTPKAFRLASYIRENLTKKLDELNETEIRNLYPYFDDYIRLKTIERTALKTLTKTVSKIKSVILKGIDIPALERPDLVVDAFRLSSFIREDLLKNPDDINEVATKISKINEETRRLILRILDASRKLALKEAEKSPATLFLVNKMNQILKRRRKTYSFVQLRNQIDYRKLLSVFPCWIMSIEDVARIFPLQAGLFDYLIVDEASQCNQATALHLAYRAKRMIVVGDRKQMKNPNTQFLNDSVVRLNLTKHRMDKHPKAEFFHGRNSLLDLALGCQDISPVFLNEHFRCEPPIIEFSNKHFYDKNLKILTPFRRRRFNPCMEIRVINGAYDDPDTKQNIVEARAVIEELKRIIENGELEGDRKGEKLTLGILSPFRQQASLLQSMVYEIFNERPHIIKEHEIIISTVDGFQGDERDVILYSFRYAPNSKPGTIHVLQREDEHSLGRLNVAFSRARRKVVCFISMPKDNFPKGLIKEYLNHVAIVQGSSYSRLGNPNEREKCQSDFEKDVFDELVRKGLEVYSQIPCAGFFIDFVVIDKEGRRMAVECDGGFHYEEGELREEDYQRQDIIERYGWFVHRISSRKFYAAPQKTIERLIEELQKQPVDKEIYVEKTEELSHFEKHLEPTESFKESKLLFDEKAFFEKSIREKIMEILSEESLPVWAIAQKLRIPKEETLIELRKLLETEWVIEIYEDGVKKWKAID